MSSSMKRKASKRKGKERSVVREQPTHKYGASTLLSRQVGPAKMIEHISKGLPFGELEHLRSEIDEPLELLARRLSISRSTLQRRKADRRLSPQESDRVMRLWRLFRQATSLFGNAVKARAWLKHPQFGLGGAVPLDYAQTELGAREVENLLGRIKFSVYS
jgi:putative toxin-antitoxin system antitoxin component (TIGR02293 family)